MAVKVTIEEMFNGDISNEIYYRGLSNDTIDKYNESTWI